MASYNGEKFIGDQLSSFEGQDHHRWHLYVSDDGSTDATRSIVTKFAARRARRNEVRLVEGPRKGFVANFLIALSRAPNADYFALSDQDDIWEEGKLTRALSWFMKVQPGLPALYCGRSRTADIEGRPVGLSTPFMRPPSFANSLVQNIGGGNTMVMNIAARDLIRQAGCEPDVVFHDWWIYQLVSGAGGMVFYDLHPSILYRQHGANLIGDGTSLRSRLGRLNRMMKGEFQTWMERNLGALCQVRHLLTVENRVLLDEFVKLRQRSCFGRVVGIRRLGIERQTWVGNVSLGFAAVLGKL